MKRPTQEVKDRIAYLWRSGMNSKQIMDALDVPEKTALRLRPKSCKVRQDRARDKMLTAPLGSSINLPRIPPPA